MKIRALLPLVPLALFLAPGLAGAATIDLTGMTSADGTVSATIAISGVESLAEPSLGAYDLDLSYDTSVLAFTSIDFGSFLGGPSSSLQDVNVSGGVVDFAEVSLLSTALLQAIQPDDFILATVYFTSLVMEETLTELSITSAILSDGNGAQISASLPGSIELTAVIPEPGGAHVFALGVLLAFAGRSVLRPGS